jgi:hypothetical protein
MEFVHTVQMVKEYHAHLILQKMQPYISIKCIICIVSNNNIDLKK